MTDNNSDFTDAFAQYMAARDAAFQEKQRFAQWCKLEEEADEAFEDVVAIWRVTHGQIERADIGRRVSRAEALRISQEMLDRAERERLDEGHADVETLRDAVIEEARRLCAQVEVHSVRIVEGDGPSSREKQIIDLSPLCHAVRQLQKAEGDE